MKNTNPFMISISRAIPLPVALQLSMEATYNNKSKSTRRIIYFITCLLLIAYCLLPTAVFAQKDTAKKATTIDITSTYKPVLRSAVKINLAASHLKPDSTNPKLEYDIPAQNLFYTYQPIPLTPAALQMDSNLNLGLRNYLKAGVGNLSTAYLSGGFSFGNGKKYLANLYTDYISSKGKIEHQDFSKFTIKGTGSYFLPRNEVYGSATISQTVNYLYGYDHALYNYKKKDSLRNPFQDIALRAGIRNTVMGDYGISYNPSIEISNFVNKDKLEESSLVLNAPVKKEFGDALAVKVEARADITTYHSKGFAPNNIRLSNNVFQVSPSLAYSSPKFSINAGLIPTWNNGTFVWLPNVYAEGQVPGKIFLLQAGWVGRYTKNTFRNLSAINPYLKPLTAQQNTKEIEYYGGLKATIGKHFNFSAKAGLVRFTNMQFFVNDTTTDGRSFVMSNEDKVNDLRVHGDLSYVNQDKFTVTAGLTLNGYTGMKNNLRAWNTVPMEITGSVRWWAYKQVMLKADLYAFGGGNYLTKGNLGGNFRPGTDLSAGVEFKINKSFSAWLDVNNLLNNKYERWHNYPVNGLSVLGGLKLNF